jgi:hypothetical protein
MHFWHSCFLYCEYSSKVVWTFFINICVLMFVTTKCLFCSHWVYLVIVMSVKYTRKLIYFTNFHITLHYITFHGSKVSQNHCRMWNKSYNYKNTYTVQLKHSKSTHTHTKTNTNTHTHKSNTINLHYVHKHSVGSVSFRQ